MTTSVLLLGALLAIATGIWARAWNRSAIGWALFGGACFIVAAPILLVIGPNRWPCPACMELIKEDATSCPHCRRDLEWAGLDHAKFVEAK